MNAKDRSGWLETEDELDDASCAAVLEGTEAAQDSRLLGFVDDVERSTAGLSPVPSVALATLLERGAAPDRPPLPRKARHHRRLPRRDIGAARLAFKVGVAAVALVATLGAVDVPTSGAHRILATAVDLLTPFSMDAPDPAGVPADPGAEAPTTDGQDGERRPDAPAGATSPGSLPTRRQPDVGERPAAVRGTPGSPPAGEPAAPPPADTDPAHPAPGGAAGPPAGESAADPEASPLHADTGTPPPAPSGDEGGPGEPQRSPTPPAGAPPDAPAEPRSEPSEGAPPGPSDAQSSDAQSEGGVVGRAPEEGGTDEGARAAERPR